MIPPEPDPAGSGAIYLPPLPGQGWPVAKVYAVLWRRVGSKISGTIQARHDGTLRHALLRGDHSWPPWYVDYRGAVLSAQNGLRVTFCGAEPLTSPANAPALTCDWSENWDTRFRELGQTASKTDSTASRCQVLARLLRKCAVLHVGARVICDGMRGIVVCSIDTGEGDAENPIAQWAISKQGL
jgi:hypothetical protein